MFKGGRHRVIRKLCRFQRLCPCRFGFLIFRLIGVHSLVIMLFESITYLVDGFFHLFSYRFVHAIFQIYKNIMFLCTQKFQSFFLMASASKIFSYSVIPICVYIHSDTCVHLCNRSYDALYFCEVVNVTPFPRSTLVISVSSLFPLPSQLKICYSSLPFQKKKKQLFKIEFLFFCSILFISALIFTISFLVLALCLLCFSFF